jgi:co-chaperonin GroES (HSP10)
MQYAGVEFTYDDLNDAFPSVDPGIKPFGNRVLVQLRSAKKVTKGGVIIMSEARETEMYNTQIAKVVATGPLAFKNRTTLETWPEGSWCEVGDFVRVPKYGGDRWSEKIDNENDILFVIFQDTDIIGSVYGDPLKIKAYI